MDKMDNVNFISTNSISNNLNLHAKPMDFFTKNGMDARREKWQGEDRQYRTLETIYKGCFKKLEFLYELYPKSYCFWGPGSIQPNSSSIQGRQQYFQRSQSQLTSKPSNIEGKWGQDRYNNPMGCSLLPVHDQFPKDNSTENDKEKLQEISETSEKTFSAPRSNLLMDNYHGARSQMSAKNNQHLLEIKPGRDCQPCIWCVSYGSQLEPQAEIMCNSTSKRQLSSSSRSIWKCDSKTGILGVQKLLGNECLDFFMPVETRSLNQVSNNISTQQVNNGTMRKLQSYSELVETLKNNHKIHEFHGPTDEWLIDQEDKEYINKTYGIAKIDPLFVSRSRMTLLFLDQRGILFAWSEMVYDMQILGINKLEGLANYLYHPEKICYIMRDTGELVPKVELNRRVEEMMAKEKLEKENLAKENREKRLAKKKRVAEEKRLAKEKRLAEEKKSGLRIET
ncbi:hypothetical protein C1645_816991 [Glomus cerebriforme]|uniref:Uncharacterized protein n=1 Tax=Glomus cerebriforme TaxID=658196 RepID=A0A397TFV7_9GLOM|nr:hypothetical protein C1645_816991 [Glomus cerebriforme]